MKVREIAKISGTSDAYKVFKRWERKRQEHFLVLTLDAANQPIQVRVATIGILNQAVIAPREIFYWAIKDNAKSIIIAHNHPSGDVHPSDSDKDTTRQLVKAGGIMGIRILDHLVIGKGNWHSMAEYKDVDFK